MEDRAQFPWKGAQERVRASSCSDLVTAQGAIDELFWNIALIWRLNTGERPIANKYREGKMKRTLKRESNSA
ncbi:hypothetical protein CR513_10215, partial [Mucuna pruriens]